MLYSAVKNTLNELVGLLLQLDETDYVKPCYELGNATIGQHTRHIIEMFRCSVNDYSSGVINYDNRTRNKKIETDLNFAMKCVEEIILNMEKENKQLFLEQNISGVCLRIESSYDRELLYNLEHCIHHQALIKVAVLNNNKVFVSENFGVAPSTIEYRKACAQ